MKEVARRAIRTFVQAFLGVYLAGVAGAEVGVKALADVGTLDAAFGAGVIAVLTFAHNLAEEKGVVPDCR